MPGFLGLAWWAELLQERQELQQPWPRCLQSEEERPSLLHMLWFTIELPLKLGNLKEICEGSDGKQLLLPGQGRAAPVTALPVGQEGWGAQGCSCCRGFLQEGAEPWAGQWAGMGAPAQGKSIQDCERSHRD